MTSVTVGSGERWELGELVGSGGAGRVHLATCGAYEPHVIKLVPKADGALRELTITRNLDGVPNVVPVLDTGRTETHLALLMPKADCSLRDHIEAAGRPLPEGEALAILCDIARALAGLVRARTADGGMGVVHRDLKPENVLYLDGAWSLSDFGIARYADRATEMHTRRYGMTPHYAAPEQWRGETATAETDVYAFGVIAYELLMGTRPFTGADLRQQHLHDDVPPMEGVSPPLATIIAECLYKPAGTRPLPTRLMERLEGRAGATPSVTRGMSALQSANLSETIRRGQETRRAQFANEGAERRTSLLKIAGLQWAEIGSSLKSTILEHAPTCSTVGLDSGGWQLQLNEGAIAFSGILPEDSSRSSRTPPNDLPFEVIAHCYVAVGDPTRNSGAYIGRAHSLWFCDAHEEGRFQWFETGFTVGDSEVSPHHDGYEYIKAPWGRLLIGTYLPFAVLSYDRRALKALGVYETDGERFKLAWPFTPLAMGELDSFIDRWVTWFAQASQGELPPPAVTSTPEPEGSWRQPSPRPHPVAQNRPRQSELVPVSYEVDEVMSQVNDELGRAESGTAHGIMVAPHLPSGELHRIQQELRAVLNIQPEPDLVFKHMSDKKYRPPATVGGLAGWATARLAPLRLLDGTRYEEFTFASASNPRLVAVERREPSRGGHPGRLLVAFVVVAAEAAGALRNGRPSPSLRDWFDQPEMVVLRAAPNATPHRPYTAEEAQATGDAILRASGIDTSQSGYQPLPGEVGYEGDVQIDHSAVPKMPMRKQARVLPSVRRPNRRPPDARRDS